MENHVAPFCWQSFLPAYVQLTACGCCVAVGAIHYIRSFISAWKFVTNNCAHDEHSMCAASCTSNIYYYYSLEYQRRKHTFSVVHLVAQFRACFRRRIFKRRSSANIANSRTHERTKIFPDNKYDNDDDKTQNDAFFFVVVEFLLVETPWILWDFEFAFLYLFKWIYCSKVGTHFV